MPDQTQDTSKFKHLTFEEAYAKLEKIVEQLETNSLPLDESMALFEEGQQLSAYCQQLLDKADLRVSTLTSNNSLLSENDETSSAPAIPAISATDTSEDNTGEDAGNSQEPALSDTETVRIKLPVAAATDEPSVEVKLETKTKFKSVESDQIVKKTEKSD